MTVAAPNNQAGGNNVPLVPRSLLGGRGAGRSHFVESVLGSFGGLLIYFYLFLVVLQTRLNEMIHSRLVSSAVVLILQSSLTHLYYYLFALAFGTFSAFLLVQPVADDKNALKLHYKDRSWYK